MPYSGCPQYKAATATMPASFSHSDTLQFTTSHTANLPPPAKTDLVHDSVGGADITKDTSMVMWRSTM